MTDLEYIQATLAKSTGRNVSLDDAERVAKRVSGGVAQHAHVLRNLNPVIDMSYRETQEPSGLFQSEKWTDVPTYHLVPVAP